MLLEESLCFVLNPILRLLFSFLYLSFSEIVLDAKEYGHDSKMFASSHSKFIDRITWV